MSGAEAVPGWLRPLVTALGSSHRRRAVVAARPGVGARQAAVLVLMGDGATGPEILFIERASTLRTHAGQIALPGGAADPHDADLAATALREAYEETNVDPAGIDVLGTLPPAHVAVSGFDVTAVLAWWRQRSPVIVADPREVASVLVVPVAHLVDPAYRVTVRHPSGYIGPAFQVDEHLIWGLTAHLIDGVLELGRWQRPWDVDRHADIPARYLTGHRAGAASDQRDTGGPDAH